MRGTASALRESLQILAEKVTDPELRFALGRLDDDVDAIEMFRSAGRYSEAKYSAKVLLTHVTGVNELCFSADRRQEVSHTKQALEAYGEEVLRLPDTVSVTDRSAHAVTRKNEPPGPELYPIGTEVRVRPLNFLEEFKRTWTYHHPLANGQLKFAGHEMVVRDVSYYHGGDVLYVLDGADGFIWHEQCLAPISANTIGA